MVSLTSNQGSKDLHSLYPGIWIGHMALTLGAQDLSGSAIGSKVVEPVYNGKVGSPPFFEDAIDGQIKIIDCLGF